MPTNKHASFRYRVLNQCFTNRGRRKWSLTELMNETSRYLREEFGADTEISKRTIQGDINVMRSRPPRGFNAPILCLRGLYCYSDPDYSIERHALCKDELDLLREALALVKQMPGMSHLPLLDHMSQRFEGLGITNGFLSSCIQIETNHLARGTEWITPIYEAIVRQQVIHIRYRPFMEEETEYFVHPYLLKEWRNCWYLFGREGKDDNHRTRDPMTTFQKMERQDFIPRKDGVWNFALDRITALAPLEDVPYLPNDVFDPDTWFDDIVGITKPEDTDPVHIELEVDPLASYYVETRPLHRSQNLVSRTDNQAVFSLRLIPNDEIMNDILAYGKFIRVRSPLSFKQMLAEQRGK